MTFNDLSLVLSSSSTGAKKRENESGSQQSRRGQGEERKRICAELMLLLAPFTCEEGRRIEGKSAVE